MSVSPTVLLVTLALGVPLMLLALGVLYHAYLFSRQPMDLLEDHVDSLATESAEELLFALQEAVDEMQAQLVSQRETLAGMLSGGRPGGARDGLTGERLQPAFAAVAPLSLDTFEDGTIDEDDDLPAAAGEFVSRGTSGVRSRIAQLADEGLSDRAIARELHIGLEEVRIARMSGRTDRTEGRHS